MKLPTQARILPALVTGLSMALLADPGSWCVLGTLAGIACILSLLPFARATLLAGLLPGLALGCFLSHVDAVAIRRTAALAAWQDGSRVRFTGWIVNAPIQGERGCRFRLRLLNHADLEYDARSPGSCSVLSPGDLIRARGDFRTWPGLRNPGGFPLRRYKLSRSVAGMVRLVSPPVLLGGRVSGPGLSLERLRHRILRRLSTPAMPRELSGILLALAIGERRELSPETRELFVRSGLAHLLAISGLHLALTAALLLPLLRLLLVGLRMRPLAATQTARLLTCCAVILQTLLAGAPPSCVRAATMLTYYLLGLVMGRRPDVWNALSLAAGINLALRPACLYEPGFQLSMAATLAIVLAVRMQPPRDGGLDTPRTWRYLVTLFRVSLAAWLGTAGISAWHFGALQPMAVTVNMAAVPLVSFALMPTVLAAAVASLVCPMLLPPIKAMAVHLLFILHSAAAFWSSVLPELWIAEELRLLLLLACLAGLILLCRPRLLPAVGFVSLLLVLLSAVPSPQDRLDLWLLHVGNGNLALLRLPDGRAVLIDGGPPGSGRHALLPLLKHAGVMQLDQVIISHGHEDHWRGLAELGPRLSSGQIITNGSPASLIAERALSSSSPVDVLHLRSGSFSQLLAGVSIMIISPAASPEADLPDENNRSLAVHIRWRNKSMLFTGDLGPRGWEGLRGRLPPEDGPLLLLQIPHHGRRDPHISPMIHKLKPLISFTFTAGHRLAWGDILRPGHLHSDPYFPRLSNLDGPLHLVIHDDGRVTAE